MPNQPGGGSNALPQDSRMERGASHDNVPNPSAYPGTPAYPSPITQNAQRADGQPNQPVGDGSMSVNDPIYGRQNANIKSQTAAAQRAKPAQVNANAQKVRDFNNYWANGVSGSNVPDPSAPIGPTTSGMPLSTVPNSAPNDGSWANKNGQNIDPTAPNYHATGSPRPEGADHFDSVGTGVLPGSDKYGGADLDKIGKTHGVDRRPDETDAAYQGRIRDKMVNDPKSEFNSQYLPGVQKGRDAEAAANAPKQPTAQEQNHQERVAAAKAIQNPKDRAAALRDIERDEAATEKQKGAQAASEKAAAQRQANTEKALAISKQKADDARKRGDEATAIAHENQARQKVTAQINDDMKQMPKHPELPKGIKDLSGKDKAEAMKKYNEKAAAYPAKIKVWSDAHQKNVDALNNIGKPAATPGATTQPTTQPGAATPKPVSMAPTVNGYEQVGEGFTGTLRGVSYDHAYIKDTDGIWEMRRQSGKDGSSWETVRHLSPDEAEKVAGTKTTAAPAAQPAAGADQTASAQPVTGTHKDGSKWFVNPKSNAWEPMQGAVA